MKTTKTEVTADIVVFRKKPPTIEIALIQRKNDPYAGKWALPGGFVETDEGIKKAAIRELQEETGLQQKESALQFIYFFDDPDRDPRGRIISFAFAVEVGIDAPIKGGDDAGDARWFALDDLPELAFDHQSILSRYFGK